MKSGLIGVYLSAFRDTRRANGTQETGRIGPDPGALDQVNGEVKISHCQKWRRGEENDTTPPPWETEETLKPTARELPLDTVW
jgi:hypothetical protein